MDAAVITSAAMACLDRDGLDELSMRRIAAYLDVHAGGLYYHVPDKAALLRSMATEICREALERFDATPIDTGWTEQTTALCKVVRSTLRAHRDAARVLAAGPLNGSVGALALMNRLIALLETGVPANVGIAADTLMSYVTGFVLQEQVDRSQVTLAEPLTDLQARYPRVFRESATSDDDVFDTAIRSIIRGFTPGPATAAAGT